LAAAVGDATAIPKPDVDIVLHTRVKHRAGELWSLSGDPQPIAGAHLPVDQTTTMTLAPEMTATQTTSIGWRVLSDDRPGEGAEIVRIDPGSYAVV
jgi:hypothetical protein